MYWPDEGDQKVCLQFMREDPVRGFGMCYLFGAYRQAGWERDIAAQMAWEACMKTDEHEEESP
jgi:hypothetical protein